VMQPGQALKRDAALHHGPVDDAPPTRCTVSPLILTIEHMLFTAPTAASQRAADLHAGGGMSFFAMVVISWGLCWPKEFSGPASV
jgi:hypothetical protein